MNNLTGSCLVINKNNDKSIQNSCRLTFFSDKKIDQNIKNIKRFNQKSIDFTTKVSVSSNSNIMQNSIKNDFLPSIIKNKKSSISYILPKNQASNVKIGVNSPIRSSFMYKNNERREQSINKLGISANFNKQNINTLTEIDIDEIYNNIFKKNLSSLFNISQLRSQLNNTSNDNHYKNKIKTEKSILEALELFIRNSPDNRKIVEVKDKIYFVKGLVDYSFGNIMKYKYTLKDKTTKEKVYKNNYSEYKVKCNKKIEDLLEEFNNTHNIRSKRISSIY